MAYERSLAIQRRLGRVLELVGAEAYSTPEIAEKLGVSVPTVSRDMTALREQGHPIQAMRHGSSWRYVLTKPDSVRQRRQLRQQKGR